MTTTENDSALTTLTGEAALSADNQRSQLALEEALIMGDLSKLTNGERLRYYAKVCQSLGLNPFTQPFAYISLNGKLTLYAKRDCTDQLRNLRRINITKLERIPDDDLYIIVASGELPDGRTDWATGAVMFKGLQGQAKADAMMKAETKSKRRLTLSLAGLGWLDEVEVESVDDSMTVEVDPTTGEILPTEYDGTVEVVADKPGADMVLRFGDEGISDYDMPEPMAVTGFKLLTREGNRNRHVWVLLEGEKAEEMFDPKTGEPFIFDGDRVHVSGHMELVPWWKETTDEQGRTKRQQMPHPYKRVRAVDVEVISRAKAIDADSDAQNDVVNGVLVEDRGEAHIAQETIDG